MKLPEKEVLVVLDELDLDELDLDELDLDELELDELTPVEVASPPKL
jgi:hypothetical protein